MVGRVRRGACWFAVSATGVAAAAAATRWPATVPVALPTAGVLILATAVGWVDAFRVGRRSARPLPSSPAAWAAATAVLCGVVIVGRWLPVYARVHWGEAFVIPTRSMSPTLVVDDRILVHKRQPWGRWNIVAFHVPTDPKTSYVKRVVGLPGETVQVVDGRVVINGTPVVPPPGVGRFDSVHLVPQRNGTAARPVTLGPDELFVVGDNPVSTDSRYWDKGAPGHQPAAVPVGNVIGAATYVYWPPSRWRRL